MYRLSRYLAVFAAALCLSVNAAETCDAGRVSSLADRLLVQGSDSVEQLQQVNRSSQHAAPSLTFQTPRLQTLSSITGDSIDANSLQAAFDAQEQIEPITKVCCGLLLVCYWSAVGLPVGICLVLVPALVVLSGMDDGVHCR